MATGVFCGDRFSNSWELYYPILAHWIILNHITQLDHLQALYTTPRHKHLSARHSILQAGGRNLHTHWGLDLLVLQILIPESIAAIAICISWYSMIFMYSGAMDLRWFKLTVHLYILAEWHPSHDILDSILKSGAHRCQTYSSYSRNTCVPVYVFACVCVCVPVCMCVCLNLYNI